MKTVWKVFKIYFITTFVTYGFFHNLANTYQGLYERNQIKKGKMEGNTEDYKMIPIWVEIFNEIKRAFKNGKAYANSVVD